VRAGSNCFVDISLRWTIIMSEKAASGLQTSFRHLNRHRTSDRLHTRRRGLSTTDIHRRLAIIINDIKSLAYGSVGYERHSEPVPPHRLSHYIIHFSHKSVLDQRQWPRECSLPQAPLQPPPPTNTPQPLSPHPEVFSSRHHHHPRPRVIKKTSSSSSSRHHRGPPSATPPHEPRPWRETPGDPNRMHVKGPGKGHRSHLSAKYDHLPSVRQGSCIMVLYACPCMQHQVIPLYHPFVSLSAIDHIAVSSKKSRFPRVPTLPLTCRC
jgi:hypothetical protein